MATFGVVDKVEARTVNTKYGPKPVYDIYIDGTKYSWGFANPTKMGVTDGAEIEFDSSPDRYGPKIDTDTVVVKTSGSGRGPVKAAPASGGKRASGEAGFPVPVTSDRISILRQNALTNARELVSGYPSLFNCDSDPDTLVEKILEIARVFADYTSGRDVEKKLEKLTSKMEE